MKTKPGSKARRSPDADRGSYRIIGHREGEVCPCCRKASFCDDCGLCEACGFSPPVVALRQPPWPEPPITCAECGGTVLHARTCSVTRHTLAN